MNKNEYKNLSFNELKKLLVKNKNNKETYNYIRECMKERYIDYIIKKSKKKEHYIIEDEDGYCFSDNDFNSDEEEVAKVEEPIQQGGNYTDEIKKKIKLDRLNNKLMERMNAEIGIRTERKSNVIMKPYSQSNMSLDDFYNKDIKNNDFSSSRFID